MQRPAGTLPETFESLWGNCPSSRLLADVDSNPLRNEPVFRRLITLLQLGKGREWVDLLKVKLTHHSLRHTGNRWHKLGGETGKLQPLCTNTARLAQSSLRR